MDFEMISEMLTAQPFVPFKFVLNDGSEHEVRNPDFCLLEASDMIYVFHPSDERVNRVSHPTRIVGVNITRIEPLAEQAA
jgi:hypothetical protein